MDGWEEIIVEFLVESHEDLDQLERDLVALEQTPGSRELLASAFRTIHTMKGTSGFLALSKLESVAHVGESLLAELRDRRTVADPATADALLAMVDVIRALLGHLDSDGSEGDLDVEPVVRQIEAVLARTAVPAPRPAETVLEPATDDEPERSAAASSVRVDVDVLDELVRLTGELLLAHHQVLRQVELLTDDEDLTRAAHRLDRIAGELQEGIRRTRTQPVDALWAKLPRVVRDLGAQCGRRVRLDVVGRETELDRTLLEAVKGPLTHLVRNAVDHGIESPEERVAAGKPAEGVLRLTARHESGQVVLEVHDDGRGIDPAVVSAAAVRRGVVTQEALDRMSAADVLQLVFTPGFSTATAVTTVSGRGVGMDVVKADVEGVGGTVEIESVAGVGTTCRLRIPQEPAPVTDRGRSLAVSDYSLPLVNPLV